MPIPSQLRRRRRELTQNVKCQAVHPVLHWGQGHPSHLASSPPANKILPKYLQSIFYYYGKNEIKKKKHVSIRERVYCTLETTGGGGGGGGGSGGGDGTVWETEGGAAAAACGEAIIIIFLFGFCFRFHLLYIKQFVFDL
jgi:hypothetical protein